LRIYIISKKKTHEENVKRAREKRFNDIILKEILGHEWRSCDYEHAREMKIYRREKTKFTIGHHHSGKLVVS